MNIYTIGFTGKSAEDFFTAIDASNATRLIDIRINRTSQLSGFAKERDLGFFLSRLLGVKYEVNPEFAPTKELLSRYRREEINWDEYAREYNSLIKGRNLFTKYNSEYFTDSILLCSENSPKFCHRRVFAEILKELFQDIEIFHL